MSKSYVTRGVSGDVAGRVTALRDLNLHVASGEIYGLLGPNGAGKTTAMRAAVGLLTPDEGRVSLGGADVRHRGGEKRSRSGYVAMDMHVYARFTPVEYLAFFGEVEGLGARQAIRRARQLLERLDAQLLGDIRMDVFSAGQQQRVAFGPVVAVLALAVPLGLLVSNVILLGGMTSKNAREASLALGPGMLVVLVLELLSMSSVRVLGRESVIRGG